MAQPHYKGLFKKALLQFVTEPDPVLAMLEWVAGQMMQIEAEAKVGAEKGRHAKDRRTYFSGEFHPVHQFALQSAEERFHGRVVIAVAPAAEAQADAMA